jgi:hypothetical protein
VNVFVTVAGFCVIAAVMSASLLGLALLRTGQAGPTSRVAFVAGFITVLIAVPTASALAVLGSAGAGFTTAFPAALAVTLAVLVVNLAVSPLLARRAGH